MVGKRVFTKLLNNNIPPSEVVAQMSGHNNLLSLNQYNSVYTKTMGNVNRNPSCQQWCFYNEDITDAELLAASQEIEETLQTIEIFEHFNNQLAKPNRVQNVDLPFVHNPDGSMSVEMTFEPSKGFVNCTCNAHVSIVMK